MLTGKNNEEKIWNYLKGAGLSDCGTAGLMGNLYAESGLCPDNLQNTYEKKLGYTDAAYTAAVDSGAYSNFVRDCAGYGLAQWTFWSRKQSLLEFAKSRGRSIGDLEMQLDFLMKELREGYQAVLSTLKTACSVRAASDAVLLNFERPADTGPTTQAKRAGFGQKYYSKYAGGNAASAVSGGKKMTAKELVEKAIDIAKNHNTVYMWGVFGAPVMESVIAGKAKQYPSWYTASKQAAFRRLIGKGYFGFDCVCLIKGILWGWSGDSSKSYGGAAYASNGVPDIGADTMISKCSGVSTTGWGNMEIGEALWCSGHIGLYIGGGLAVECTPAWENKVQITAVKNIGSKAGYNARQWTKHGKLPYVTYDGSTEKPGTTPPPETSASGAACKVGDIVEYTGTKHYASANAANGPDCKPGKAKITQVYQPGKAKHPYHLVAVPGGGSTVYGWVDAADIAAGTTGGLTVGDQVKMDAAATVYGTTRKFSSWVYAAKLYVREIDGDRIVVSTLKSGAVTGAVNQKYLTKV